MNSVVRLGIASGVLLGIFATAHESHSAMALGKHVADVLLLEPSDPSLDLGVLHRAGTCECHCNSLHKFTGVGLLVRPWMGVGCVLFGLGLKLVGLALGTAIVLGLNKQVNGED